MLTFQSFYLGEYTDGSAATACAKCAVGKYGVVSGASTCVDCPAGHNVKKM